MNSRSKIRLGDLLVEKGFISQNQLEQALADQKSSGRKLGHILIENGYVREDDMLQMLSKQLMIPFIDLLLYTFVENPAGLLAEDQARRFRAIVLSQGEQGLLLGMADPTNTFVCDELEKILPGSIRLAVVRESDLLKTLDTIYSKSVQSIGPAVETFDRSSQSNSSALVKRYRRYQMKLYMVVEHFNAGTLDEIYERFDKKGRMLPEGLYYLNSWLSKDGDKCFQLMETNDSALFQKWIKNWDDLVTYEITEIGQKPGD